MDLMAGMASAENGPILYTEPNRTSAVDDPRSLVIYVFIITIFLSFFLILPGIRSDKFPTFLCITSSLLVTSIILLSILGTTWHTGKVSISAPYKAFSVDRIHGELIVRIGLRSVNISLIAHKYYELANSQRPVLMVERASNASSHTDTTSTTTRSSSLATSTGTPVVTEPVAATSSPATPPEEGATELASNETSDTEILELDEAFISSRSGADGADNNSSSATGGRARRATPGANSTNRKVSVTIAQLDETFGHQLRYTVERSNVDINYNERFFWIEPNQMRQEHQSALERGLPFPILTVVEYLSQDEAGFSWSRQYRLAGYYSHILLTWALCLCLLMFFLHCATPKYGIYAMQILGCLLLFTNFTYSTLVPRGDQRLVIPFEGRQLEFQFGWSYWLVFAGGCLSLSVGTLIVIIDSLFPNYIFTTILDVDFDLHNNFLHNTRVSSGPQQLDEPSRPAHSLMAGAGLARQRLAMPPFMADQQKQQQHQDINDSALARRPSFIAETTEPFSSEAARLARPSLLAGVGHTNMALEEEPEEEAAAVAEEEEKADTPVALRTPEMVSRHRQRPQKLAASVVEMP